ncbi:cyclin-Y-like protein 1-like protein [Sarcoptes scabiei]|uniref:Cyclin-Y-like protein 1-like protein n=1 Tax=Sarcoptes scabiei TaxID=52283 RepID=A0A132AI31_SARSC|nr:cyclin-Y-like protein 1-like protein [Sarcoptes scabiei]
MGNRFSCCKTRSHSLFKRKENSLNQLSTATLSTTTNELKYDETILSLQHISERELTAINRDPSIHPTAGPLFLVSNDNKISLNETRLHNKSSSCSTVFLDDCTISHPNFKLMIKCVSMAIYYHIVNRSSDNVLEIFDEKNYPLKASSCNQNVQFPEPDFRTIYRFMRTLFITAHLSSECAIITLVYLERLLTLANVDLMPQTWRRIVLGAILLASKVWDDQAVWNVDYCQIIRESSIDDMNDLERCFLELIQFNINVPSSVYAKYYFELRQLAEKNDLIHPVEILNEYRAHKLEAMSRFCGNYYNNPRKNFKKWSSFDSIPGHNHRKSAAVIS